MNDDIQLPPLPALGLDTVRKAEQIFNYARVAVLADRERRAKQEAKPVVHSTTLRLCPDGYAWRGTDVEAVAPGYGVLVDLRWTDDGRVWIESARSRELARKLRFYPSSNYDAPAMHAAADALDGGER